MLSESQRVERIVEYRIIYFSGLRLLGYPPCFVEAL